MNETIKNLITRKSCKSYQERHIEKELIDQIVEAGLNAPSGMNMQLPRLVVVTNYEVVKKLASMNAGVMNMPTDPFYGAKDLIIVLAKKERTYIYDGSLVMGNLLNAAFSLGVGACWIHRAKEVFDTKEGKKLLEEWGIIEDVEGIGFCILGYPKNEKAKTEIKPNRVFYVE